MESIKVVFMGTPVFSTPILQALIDNYNVVGVVTAPDAYIGRKKVLTACPVKELAMNNNIKVFSPVKLRNEYQDILDLEPDIIITCAYGQIVPEEVLNYPRLGCINIHASLLPKYRGASPIRSVIINGEKQTGITLMYMDKTLDTGDMIRQKRIDIDVLDNNETLSNKLSKLGAELIIEQLPYIIKGTNSRVKQDEKKATYVGLITREDEHLDFDDTADNIYNKIRAFAPDIYANFLLDDKEFKIVEATPYFVTKDDFDKAPGTIISENKNGFVIKAKDAGLLITMIKPFGKKEMKFSDFKNGYHDSLVGKVVK